MNRPTDTGIFVMTGWGMFGRASRRTVLHPESDANAATSAIHPPVCQLRVMKTCYSFAITDATPIT